MSHPLSRRLFKLQSKQKFTLGTEEYVLGGKIGDGAAGLVRKAERLRDRKTFAVKFLAPDPKYIEEAVFDDVAARFLREGERGAKLDHPFLLKIFDYCSNEKGSAFNGGVPTNPFIVMELASGRTLESYIRKLPHGDSGSFIVDEKLLDIGIQIAEALEFLHKKRLVHRDVKPANIFLSATGNEASPHHVRLGDFGIVKWGDFHSSLSTGVLTATNQRGLGTLKYMSPEQSIAPKNVTTKSDIFSLGITLFELLAGRILASPHHVFEVMTARLARGSTMGRFASMGYKLPFDLNSVGDLLLDMHLRGLQGRPTIERILGTLRMTYEEIMGKAWRPPV